MVGVVTEEAGSMIDPNKALAAQGLVSGNPAYNIINGLPPFIPADVNGNPDYDALSLDEAHQHDQFFQPNRRRFKKGTSNVKKKYAKGTDSVPAMLTPKEAVLVPNAAEILGRGFIKRLNDHGNMLMKRGVDLASDPTPGPSTQNMLGYQMGAADVGRDDRADLLAEADNTFYGGGQAPAPTPTPTPAPRRAYQYGTSSVDDFDVFNKNRNAASRINRPGLINVQDDPKKPNFNPVSTSQYMGKGGTLLGPQYNPTSGRVNPLPAGAVGIQGFSQPQTYSSGFRSQPMTHTEMAADIARRNLTATGSMLGTPQQQVPGISNSTLVDQGIDPSQSMANVSMNALRNIQDNKNRQAGTYQEPAQDQSTVHFLPPGFTAVTGSSGAQGSNPNDIHFLPPGFSSVQGVTNPQTKQLQQGYGSAYGY